MQCLTYRYVMYKSLSHYHRRDCTSCTCVAINVMPHPPQVTVGTGMGGDSVHDIAINQIPYTTCRNTFYKSNALVSYQPLLCWDLHFVAKIR